MSTPLSIEIGVQQLAQKLAESLPATIASVALWDRPGSSLSVCGVGTPRPLDGSVSLWGRLPLATVPSYRAAIELEQPVFVDLDALTPHPARDEAGCALAPHLRAVYVLPLQFGGETVGVVGVGEMRSAAREPFTPDKQERCRAILEEFVASSAHAWEANRLRRQARALGSLLRMVRDLFDARSAEDVLTTCSAEIAGWLGVPVRGLLLKLTARGDVEIAARCGLDHPVTSTEAAQLLLALARETRAMGSPAWPVGVAAVADDPLDPLRTAVPDGSAWTRVSLPLPGGERLEGLICFYVEDALRLSEWELEAFRQRGELAGRGLELVRLLSEHAAEAEWFGRTAYESLTAGQRAALEEALAGIHRLVVTLLPARTERLVAEVASVGEAMGPAASGVAEALAREVASLIEGLRGVGPVADHQRREVELNALVRRVAGMVRRSLDVEQKGEPVQLSLDLAGEPLVAQASPDLVVALVHAIENARDAVAGGGQIQVRTARDDGHAVIAVEDTGPGLLGLQDDVFAPLVSTKGKPHLGLGLSVIRSVVNQHGGSATLLPREAGGACLRIRLPLADRGPGTMPDED